MFKVYYRIENNSTRFIMTKDTGRKGRDGATVRETIKFETEAEALQYATKALTEWNVNVAERNEHYKDKPYMISNLYDMTKITIKECN